MYIYIYIYISIACTVRPEHMNIMCNSIALLPPLQKHMELYVEEAGSVKGKKLILCVFIRKHFGWTSNEQGINLYCAKPCEIWNYLLLLIASYEDTEIKNKIRA